MNNLMSLLNLFEKKRLLFFVLGIVVFVMIIPGCISTANHFSQKENSAIQKTSNNPPQETSSSLGINLSGISNWSTELPFIDHFKSSRSWLTQCLKSDPGCQGKWDTGEYDLLDLDENGWVKSLPAPEDIPEYTRVSTVLFKDIPNLYPPGKYIVLYDGEGKIEYGFTTQKILEESSPGRDVIAVDSENGIYMSIVNTDPRKTGNYIRNIRVIQAEHEKLYKNGEIFNPIFLDKIKKFKALRFMGWMGTVNSQQKEWSNRPKPETINYTYNFKGVPVEIMLALSNKLKADPWFNMPHQATDDYMTRFAQLVKEKLAPDLKAYVEFSNEVWNWNFEETTYALEQGKARWGQDKADAWWHWYGMRTAQMCDIWKTVFGNQKDRVVCVISTQTGWPGIEKKVLDCPYWVAEGNKPCYQHGIDAYAITGYFGWTLGSPNNSSVVQSWLFEPDGGFSKAIQQLKKGGLLANDGDNLSSLFELFKYHKNVAEKRGLQLVAYEGGQHIAPRGNVINNQNIVNFLIELNRYPAMYNLYTELLTNWQRAGGELFMHFEDISRPGKYGSFGALEYVDQDGSPKYDALIDFIDKHPSVNHKKKSDRVISDAQWRAMSDAAHATVASYT